MVAIPAAAAKCIPMALMIFLIKMEPTWLQFEGAAMVKRSVKVKSSDCPAVILSVPPVKRLATGMRKNISQRN
jgi:hypothetical protein